MYLTVYRENFYFHIGKITQNINTISSDWKTAVEISQLFRRMGISCLFIDDDTKTFFSYLNDSGNAFLYFINKISPQDLVTSKFDAFFDALVCKNIQLAKKIASVHAASYNKDYEYQEDFFYFHFLMEFIQDKEESVLNNILKDYADILDGNPDNRFEICKAILEGDSDEFEEYLIALVQEWHMEQEKKYNKELVPPEVSETEGHIFLEGIALVRIAEKAGIRMENIFSYMPQDVIEFSPGIFVKDNWKFVAID